MKQRFFTTGQSFGLSLRTLGLLWKELMSWRKSRGEEYVIEHLKVLKMITLGSKIVPEGSGYLKGAFGKMISYRYLSLQGKLTMLDIYLSLRTSSPTPKQLNKFYTSLEREPGGEYELNKLCSSQVRLLSRDLDMKRKVEVIYHTYSNQKSIPTFGRKSGLNQSNIGFDIINFVNNEDLWGWWETHRRRYMKMNPALKVFNQYCISASLDDYNNRHVGEIQYIQEGGYKLRAVANPILSTQFLLDPLKDYLFDMVRKIPEDCTFDQGKGIRAVKDRIMKHETCFCYDLSDATNNLPYKFTRMIFDEIVSGMKSQWGWDTGTVRFFESQVDLFDLLTKGEWLTPENKSVRFGRGQPLGVGPSFALLALTHHMIMWQCGASPGSYVVLGDDVVIFDRDLATNYKEYVIGTLSVPISLDKSIISNDLAEFAGKVITRGSVLSKYRWDPMRVTNILDVLRYHGTHAVAWVPDKFKSAAVTIAALPRHLGGLSWTVPKNLSHLFNEEKYKILLEYVKEEPVLTYVSKIHRTRQVEREINSAKPLSSPLVNHVFSSGSLRKLERHPWYNVNYTKGLPEGASSYYLKGNNPNAPSGSSLIRKFLQLD